MVDVDGVVFSRPRSAAPCVPKDVVLENARSAGEITESHRIVIGVYDRATDEDAVEIEFSGAGVLGLYAFHVLWRRDRVPCGIIAQLDHVVGHNHVCIAR